MENYRPTPETPNRYTTLKEGLLNGTISPEAVRDELIALDQQTLSRTASDENLAFVYDPEIVAYIENRQELQEKYHQLVSFTEFHVAQRLAFHNSQDAVDHFQKALEYAQRIPSNDSWTAYVRGSLMYAEGKIIPDDLIAAVTQSNNAQVLRNLNAGLLHRGSPFYSEDYSAQTH